MRCGGKRAHIMLMRVVLSRISSDRLAIRAKLRLWTAPERRAWFYNGYYATTGYNLVTGLGSPKANLVIARILAANGVSEGSATARVTRIDPSPSGWRNKLAV